MAEVVQTPNIASEKVQPKKKIFGEQKQADLVIYRLIETNNVKLREDTPLYPPYRRFPNYDIIVWEGGTRAIRWLPGETSIFVDEQEKDGNRKIPDNILNNPNNRFEIIDGDIKVRPHEKTKIQFLDICNRNVDSKHRTGTIASLFRKLSDESAVAALQEKQSKQKEAMEKAFSADEDQIAFHADYLNIPMINFATNASRTFEAVQADYRQIAMDNPVSFLKTFDDEDLKLKFQIKKAIESGSIVFNIIPGKACLKYDKSEICDANKDDVRQAVDSIFNYANGKSGGAFMKKFNEL